MYWNYRVFRYDFNDEVSFTIREVYYNEDTHKPQMWSQNEIAAHGETQDELMRDYTLQAEAFTKPVLQINDDNISVSEWTG